MNTLSSITIIASFLGIAISMLDIVASGERLQKQVRFIFSLVFIIAVTSSIINSDIDFNIPSIQDIEQSEEYLAVTNTYTQCLADNFKLNIEKNIKQKLEINDIQAKQVSLIVDIDDEDKINVNGANIVLPYSESDSKQKAIYVVQNEIGNSDVNITFTED